VFTEIAVPTTYTFTFEKYYYKHNFETKFSYNSLIYLFLNNLTTCSS